MIITPEIDYALIRKSESRIVCKKGKRTVSFIWIKVMVWGLEYSMDQWFRQSFISGFHVNIGFWMPIDWWLTEPLSNSPYHSDSLRWDGGSYERIPSKHIQKLHTLSRCWIDHTRIIYFWNEIKNGEGGNAIICFKQLCCNDKGNV